MILDPISILDEQIDEMQRKCDEFELEIDEKTRYAIANLLNAIAAEEANDRMTAESLRNDRLETERNINMLSAHRADLLAGIRNLQSLKAKINQGDYPERINEYINGLRRFRVDLSA